jgi:hypothetical protein
MPMDNECHDQRKQAEDERCIKEVIAGRLPLGYSFVLTKCGYCGHISDQCVMINGDLLSHSFICRFCISDFVTASKSAP